jgi:hypothetical protein
MNDSRNIKEKPWQIPTAPDDQTFNKEEDRFLRLVKEIQEMAGVINYLAKANRRYQ